MTMQEKVIRYAPWVMAVFIAIVFVQSLFFKFSNSYETIHIFSTIGGWMASIGFPQSIADGFAAFGGYTVGTVELIASLLLLMRRTQFIGAAVGFCVISGAIFFHLFTPLGVSVVINEAGDKDGGQLFAMAVVVWVFALGIMWLRRGDVLRTN
ncbi:MAG: hypothetical protein ACR2PR_10805 [Pseudohongiellaceae bacterium]